MNYHFLWFVIQDEGDKKVYLFGGDCQKIATDYQLYGSLCPIIIKMYHFNIYYNIFRSQNRVLLMKDGTMIQLIDSKFIMNQS